MIYKNLKHKILKKLDINKKGTCVCGLEGSVVKCPYYPNSSIDSYNPYQDSNGFLEEQMKNNFKIYMGP